MINAYKFLKMHTQRKISQELIDDIGKNSDVELETCGNLLIQAQEVYDTLYLDHSALLLEKEQLIIDNKRLLYDDVIHLSVRKDFEEKIQDDISTIDALDKWKRKLQCDLNEEKDHHSLAVDNFEKYCTKLSDQNDTYKRIIWILMVWGLAFGIGFFAFLIHHLG